MPECIGRTFRQPSPEGEDFKFNLNVYKCMKKKRDESAVSVRNRLYQLFKVMKLTFLFSVLLVTSLEAAVNAQQRLTMQLGKTNMKAVFEEIQRQTQRTVVYNHERLMVEEKVNANFKNVPLEEILGAILTGSGMGYKLVDNYIVIVPVVEVAQTLLQTVKEREIKGEVRDKDGNLLPGVTVLIKGTLVGTATDAEGRFTLKVPDVKDLTLVFSFIGTKPLEIKPGTQTDLKVVMEFAAESLDEVVVTGIFERKAESFTGASVSVSSEDLKRVGNQNVFQSLKSLDPSLMIFDNMEFGSDPNKNPKMTLRGSSSIDLGTTEEIDIKGTYANDPNSPLFILDGFEASVQKIMDLDMDRVASLTILKDASAKAIYGSKAANGVIVIETKRSATGDVRVTYSGNVNIEAPDLSSYNLTNAAQKLELEKDFGLYDGKNKEEDIDLKRRYYQKYKSVVAGVNTDWMAKPLRNAVGNKHSLAIELGGRELQVLADFAYNNIQGVMKGSSRTTYDGQLQVSYRHKKFNFRNSLNVVSNVASDSPYGTFSDYAYMNPYYSPYDANGLLVKNAALSVDGLDEDNGEFVANPLYNATLNTKIEERYLDVTNNLYVEWAILQGLRATLRFGITEKRISADEFYPSNHLRFENYSADDFFRKGSYQVNNGHLKKLSGDLNVRYSTQIKEKNYLFANVGLNVAEETYEEVVHKAEGFPNDRMTDIIFARQYLKESKPDGRESTIRDIGVLGVLNYTYDNKYLLDLSLRGNASSQFGSNNRWGSFWSVGVGWNIHKEAFMNQEIFENLKVRGSVGYTGSQSQNAYASIGSYKYYMNRTYTGYLGGYLSGMRNQDLKWQKKMDYNAGIDINIKRRVSVTFDIYKSITENTLIDLTLPPSLGFTTVRENVGRVINNGFDLRTTFALWQNTRERSYVNLLVNISRNKNRLDRLSDAMKDYNKRQEELAASTKHGVPVKMYYDGASMDAIWGMRSLGIDPRNGREIYLRKDGTPTYTYDASQQVILGDAMPEFQGTGGVSFEYKGFGGNLTFRFQYGAQMYNSTLISKVENADLNKNVDIRLFDGVWRPGDEGKVKPYKQLGRVWISETGEYEQLKTNPTSRFVQDRNELALSNVSFYYDFYRCKFLKKCNMERMKLSFYLNDVFTLSSIEIERGTSYPFARNFNFSLSVTF